MNWADVANSPVPWASNLAVTPSAPAHPAIAYTRLISYRNLAGRPFVASAPPKACAAAAEELLARWPAVPGSRRARLIDCPPAVLRMLRERGIIPGRPTVFPGKGGGKWLLLRPGLKHWDLVNEAEHLTSVQAFPGWLDPAGFSKAYAPPPQSGDGSPWAWSPDLGYLNSHPARIGPGLEAEALVHLPALAAGRHLPQAWNAAFALGLACRPLSDWGEALPQSGLFHLQSRGGLGLSPQAVYEKFSRGLSSVLAWEMDLRGRLSDNGKHHKRLEERVQQSHKALLAASSLAFPRLLELASWLRLGAQSGLLPAQIDAVMEELRIIAAPGHLGVSSGSDLSKEDEDILRANVVRLSLERHRATSLG